MLTSFLYSQEVWKPLGPDDYNSPSLNSIDYLDNKILIDNDNNKIVLYKEQVYENGTFHEKFRVRKFINNRWEFLGDNNFAIGYMHADIALDKNGVLYLAFRDSYFDHKLKLKKFVNNNWENVAGEFVTNLRTEEFKIAFDNNNKVHLLYSTLDNALSKIYVQKYNGVNWEIIGNSEIINGANNDFSSFSFEIDNNNDIYVGFKRNFVYNNNAVVYKFITNTWVNISYNCFENINLNQLNLKINNNKIYVVFDDYSGNSYVKKLNNSNLNWDNITLPAIVNVSPISVINFDNNNNLYILCRKTINQISTNFVLYKLNGSNWDLIGNNLINLDLGLYGCATCDNHYYSFAFDSNNVPYVSGSDWQNFGRCTVRKLLNSNWSTIGDLSISETFYSTGQFAIDSNNMPYVYFYSQYGDNKDVLKRFNGNSWEEIIINNENNFCNDLNLIVDSNKNVCLVIKECDSSYSYIKIKLIRYLGGNNWETIHENLFTSLPYDYKVFFDRNNQVYAFYRDQNQIYKLKRFNGANWEILGQFNYPSIYFPTTELHFDLNNVPYLKIDIGFNFKILKFEGNNWTDITQNEYNSEIIYKTEMKLDNTNMLYLLYEKNDGTNNRTTLLKKFNGISWELIGSEGLGNNVKEFINFKIDSNGLIYISTLLPQSKIIRYNGQTFEIIGQDNIFVSNVAPFIDINSNNIPVLFNSNNNIGVFVKYFGNEYLVDSTLPQNMNLDKIYMFPNPVDDKFYLSNFEKIQNIEIFNSFGVKILKFMKNDINNNSVNVNNLQTGIYFLLITTENGEEKIKFIKK